MLESRNDVAYHEAGHAVASFLLGREVLRASIIEAEDSKGRVDNQPRGTDWINRLEEADYESSWGGFIDCDIRKDIESEVMIILAGGLVQMKAMGLERHEVGMGVARLSSEDADAMAKTHGGEKSDWQNPIVGGDYQQAVDLVLKVSGGDEEGAAYLQWLEERTRNFIRRPDFWPIVEVVALALKENGELSGRRLCEVIEKHQATWNADRVLRRMEGHDSEGVTTD